jgi:hypothetical protein
LQLEFASSFTSRGVQSLTRLKKLERFVFYCHDHVVDMGSMLAQNLPWLKQFERADRIPTFIKIKGVFQLEEIWAKETLPFEATFPNLKRLNFRGPLTCRKSLEFLTCCTRLNCLNVRNILSSDLLCILELVGQNLSQLELIAVESQLDLALLFHFCPNLSSFRARKVVCNPDERTSFVSKLNAHNFRLLKHFNFTLGAGVPSGIVKFLFQAPLIEEIHFPCDNVDPQLVQSAQALTFKHFKHLQTFVLEYNHRHRPAKCGTNDLAKLFAIIVSSAKTLSTCFVMEL